MFCFAFLYFSCVALLCLANDAAVAAAVLSVAVVVLVAVPVVLSVAAAAVSLLFPSLFA